MSARYERKVTRASVLLACVLALGVISPTYIAHSIHSADVFSKQGNPGSRIFPETNRSVKGKFLQYWDTHGGLMQQGYPISEEIQERSDVDGKTYTVQYFQRAVFELHPEHAGTPYEVLLSLVGKLYYQYEFTKEPYGEEPNTSPGSILFQQTGKRLGGVFLQYWQTHGGLAQQGYPITDEFYFLQKRVQFFERAVFEYHPKNKGTEYEVLLSHLGSWRYNTKYPTQPKGMAPSYDEIYNTVREIMSRHHPDPNEPHPTFPPELSGYNAALKGMIVEGWQGWIGWDGPYLEPDGITYRDTVYMEDPRGKDPRNIRKRVYLYGLSAEQVRKVEESRALHPDVRWPKVKIRGVIRLVARDGHVELNNSSIEIIE